MVWKRWLGNVFLHGGLYSFVPDKIQVCLFYYTRITRCAYQVASRCSDHNRCAIAYAFLVFAANCRSGKVVEYYYFIG